VLAPNVALRPQIVPGEANPETDIANRDNDPRMGKKLIQPGGFGKA